MKKSEMTTGMRAAWASSAYARRSWNALEVEIVEIAPAYSFGWDRDTQTQTRRIDHRSNRAGTVHVRRIDSGSDMIVRSAELVGEWSAYQIERDTAIETRRKLDAQMRAAADARNAQAKRVRDALETAFTTAGLSTDSWTLRVSGSPSAASNTTTIVVSADLADALVQILENVNH